MEKYQSVVINQKDIRVVNAADPTGFDDINAGGMTSTIRVYNAGTSNLSTIYSDNGSTQITQPFTANPDGVFFFYAANGRYDIVIDEGLSTESRDDDVFLFDSDDSQNPFDDWSSSVTYELRDLVTGSNGKYYESLLSSNLGNNPVSSATAWKEVRFLGVYNANVTYAVGDVVQTNDGNMWKSEVASNLNNNPSSDDGSNWTPSVNLTPLENRVQALEDNEYVIISLMDPSSSFTVTRSADRAEYSFASLSPTITVDSSTFSAGDILVFTKLINSNLISITLDENVFISPTDGTSLGSLLTMDAGESFTVEAHKRSDNDWNIRVY